jgi:myo-inositol-1(or 4)-monophosphatase
MRSYFSQLNHPYLNTAFEAAAQAGSIIRDAFRKKVAIQTKSLANFVSEVDLAAEQTIARCIHESYPDHDILGEEGMNTGQDSDHLWIVDPLDGTSNYLHGIAHFAVSIGYAHQGRYQLGVIYNPLSEEWFAVVRGQGAWYNGQRMQVSSEASLSETLVAVGFYYDRGKMMEATLGATADLFRQHVHGVRRFGAAALDLAQVARGDYGVFVEFKLQPWDYGAGHLMVEEAGGQITDCLNQSLPLRSHSSILATNGKLHSAVLQVIAPHFANAF